ncbi:hypothetical protein BRC93_09085 [Halobacteriales archaeon QS_5_70_15]|nr:MAG: hypothetical protein BRC93_09085 [Halobacteriales archaeon QS_5_70_15]
MDAVRGVAVGESPGEFAGEQHVPSFESAYADQPESPEGRCIESVSTLPERCASELVVTIRAPSARCPASSWVRRNGARWFTATASPPASVASRTTARPASASRPWTRTVAMPLVDPVIR